MNLDEVTELLKILTACSPENTVKIPEFRILFNHGEGYALHIKTRSVNPEFRRHLDEIVKSHKLAIRESEHYLIVYRHSYNF